jgi:glutathione peroxidase
MAAKMVVKGKDISPLFSYLTKEAAKLGVEDPIKWNFTKFLIDEKGNLVKVFNYKTKPMSEEIVDAVN